MAQDSKKKPEHIRVGSISLTIWENTGKTKQGKDVTYKTYSLQRGYKDKDGQWANTNALRLQDLPKAVLAMQEAYKDAVMKAETEEEE